jgi:hypothetical protein
VLFNCCRAANVDLAQFCSMSAQSTTSSTGIVLDTMTFAEATSARTIYNVFARLEARQDLVRVPDSQCNASKVLRVFLTAADKYVFLLAVTRHAF